MRPIKFRAWDKAEKRMFYPSSISWKGDAVWLCDAQGGGKNVYESVREHAELMQFTGLHDKNSLKELYEGDIIDADGNLKGNIYESPQIYEEGIDCLIEGMGTEKWRSTESIAMGRGCKYTK